MATPLPTTLGALRASEFTPARLARSVKDELRENLIARLRAKLPLFPGIIGYQDTVVPQIVNAVLSKHNFILLGLRGQAKSRILRSLTTLLDPHCPYVTGSEVRDNPYAPISKFSRDLIAKLGDETPIAWMTPDDRFVEKLATPDVTVADLVGDIDPIKAARSNQDLGSELTMHYGLLPRANRGIFAINEGPDLAGKIQVALFNIMQEGDVQIKGYPVRLLLDVAIVFSANPEDYTARGKIVTPLKDRIGSEIRTHYPEDVEEGIAITGKLELEYEGEMKGADYVGRELIRTAIAKTYDQYFTGANMQQIIQWFDLGGEIQLSDSISATEALNNLTEIQGLLDKLGPLQVSRNTGAEQQVSAAEFILEGLHAHKRIGRSEERVFKAGEKKQEPREREKGFDPEERPYRQKRQFN